MGSQRVRHDCVTFTFTFTTNGASQVGLVIENPPANVGDIKDAGSISGLGRSPEEGMATHSVPLPGKSHGRRSLVGYSPRGRKQSDTTEQLSHIQINFLGRKQNGERVTSEARGQVE